MATVMWSPSSLDDIDAIAGPQVHIANSIHKPNNFVARVPLFLEQSQRDGLSLEA